MTAVTTVTTITMSPCCSQKSGGDHQATLMTTVSTMAGWCAHDDYENHSAHNDHDDHSTLCGSNGCGNNDCHLRSVLTMPIIPIIKMAPLMPKMTEIPSVTMRHRATTITTPRVPTITMVPLVPMISKVAKMTTVPAMKMVPWCSWEPQFQQCPWWPQWWRWPWCPRMYYSATTPTGPLGRRLSNRNDIWKHKVLKFFWQTDHHHHQQVYSVLPFLYRCYGPIKLKV